MKVHCDQDGIHFPQDFEKTLKSPCNFWGNIQMSNVAVEMKKKIWDWYFSAPADEMFITEHLGLNIIFGAVLVKEEAEFVNLVKGYESWDEQKQQNYQRDFFAIKRDKPTLTDLQIIEMLKEPEEKVKN